MVINASLDDLPPVTVSGGQQFPKEVSAILDGLYCSGMTGWGSRPTDAIELARNNTKLTLEVCRIIIRGSTNTIADTFFFKL